MGAILACLGSEAACCLSATACRCFCQGFSCFASTATRAAYALIFLLTSLSGYLLLTDWVNEQLEKLLPRLIRLQYPCPEGWCTGSLAVYRLTFGLVLFHAILMFLVLGVKNSKDFRAGIHNGYWMPKLVVLFTLFGVSFAAIQNDFYLNAGSIIFLIGALFFILVQLLYLVDFAYSISEYCLERYESDASGEGRNWLNFLISGSLIFFLIALVFTIIMYVRFGCSLFQFFITMNWLLGLLVSAVSIWPRVQEANPVSGLPQASVVTLYATYLVFSAISNSPSDTACNPNPVPINHVDVTSQITGALFTFVSVIYSTTRMGSGGGGGGSSDPERRGLFALESSSATAAANIDEEQGAHEKYPEDDEKEACVYNYSFFHFVYMVGIMYMAMLITDWTMYSSSNGADNGDPATITAQIGKGWASLWIKVASSWVVYLMYLWTLLAPIILPDRDFA